MVRFFQRSRTTSLEKEVEKRESLKARLKAARERGTARGQAGVTTLGQSFASFGRSFQPTQVTRTVTKTVKGKKKKRRVTTTRAPQRQAFPPISGFGRV